MSHKCASFDSVCRRAGGRRAYNKRRRLERARRISAILALQDAELSLTGRELAARFGVHEATISRDLRFIESVRAQFQIMAWGAKMRASSFRWVRGARGHALTFQIRNGVRTR